MKKILKKTLWSIPVHATLSWIGVFVSTKLNDALFDYNTSMKEFMILWGSAHLDCKNCSLRYSHMAHIDLWYEIKSIKKKLNDKSDKSGD